MDQYFYSSGNGPESGPIPADELRRMKNSGLMALDTRIRRDGTSNWFPMFPGHATASPQWQSPGNSDQLIPLIGSAIMFIGVFCPFISVPILGSMNYFQNGRGDGVIFLILALVSAVCAVLKRFRWLWWTGGAALGLIIFVFMSFQWRLHQAKEEIALAQKDNPFAGLAGAAIESVQIQWGAAVLFIGAVIVLAGPVLRARR